MVQSEQRLRYPDFYHFDLRAEPDIVTKQDTLYDILYMSNDLLYLFLCP